YTMVDVLRNRDVDAAFVMCADLVCHTPADCASYLAEIPMVCLDIAPCPTTVASDVVLPGVIDAMESAGTFYRLDNVPIYFEPFTDSPFEYTKSNEDTMHQLFEKIKKMA
ncbi:MAG: formylmethanofuran dehydrogenase subunit B, partial [Methanosarcinales archaeon]|nr:formylmethanofuran dehydrogenase subunit B [Methanosarcinales archaeon]